MQLIQHELGHHLLSNYLQDTTIYDIVGPVVAISALESRVGSCKLGPCPISGQLVSLDARYMQVRHSIVHNNLCFSYISL